MVEIPHAAIGRSPAGHVRAGAHGGGVPQLEGRELFRDPLGRGIADEDRTEHVALRAIGAPAHLLDAVPAEGAGDVSERMSVRVDPVDAVPITLGIAAEALPPDRPAL